MISLLPTGSPAQTSDAYALLAIIADPAAAKKRLEELVAEKQAAQEAMEATRAATKRATDDRTAAEKALAETKKRGAAIDAEHAIKVKTLDERHDYLVAKDKRLTDYEATVAAREKELGEPMIARENVVSAREEAAQKREDELHTREVAALQMKEDYERKVAAIKDAVSK